MERHYVSRQKSCGTGRPQAGGGRARMAAQPAAAGDPDGPGAADAHPAQDGHAAADGSGPAAGEGQGPPGWLNEVRAQMRDSSAFRRRDALASLAAHAVPPAAGPGGSSGDDDGSGDGGGGTRGVHKAVLRAAAALLTDQALQVREAAQETLARLAAAAPQGRALCAKYAGLRLSTAEPVRVRLFLIQTLQLFVADALALAQGVSGGRDSAGGDDAGAQHYAWFEGARVAAVNALEAYVEAEQTALRHSKVFQHAEHGMLVETTDSEDGQPSKLLEAATGRVVWTRARFLRSFFRGVSEASTASCAPAAPAAEESQYGLFDRTSEALAAYRALVCDAKECHYSEETLLQSQDAIRYFQHLPAKTQELARLAHAATKKTPSARGKKAKALDTDERLRLGEEDRDARVAHVRLLGYSGAFASTSLPPPSDAALARLTHPQDPVAPPAAHPATHPAAARGQQRPVGEGEGEGKAGVRGDREDGAAGRNTQVDATDDGHVPALRSASQREAAGAAQAR